MNRQATITLFDSDFKTCQDGSGESLFYSLVLDSLDIPESDRPNITGITIRVDTEPVEYEVMK